MKPQTAAGVGLLVYLSGQDKIKPPTGSGRRERIGIHHDELITGVDFFFSVQIFFNIEGVLWVVVGGQLVIGVLGQVVLVRKKRSDTTQLQNALAAVQHCKLIPAHKFFATMSSGKFKKGQALSKKAVFHSACPFLIHVFCLALFETQNYNILDGGAKWII